MKMLYLFEPNQKGSFYLIVKCGFTIGGAHKLNGILKTSFTDEFCNSIAVESHID